jgi:hypothetical protein
MRHVAETLDRWRAMPPQAAVRAIYWSLVIAGVLSPLLIGGIAKLTYTNTQFYSPYFSSVISWAIVAAIAGGVLLRGTRADAPAQWVSRVSQPGATACAMSVAVGIALLVVPAFLLVWRIGADELTGWTYPFLNKRWLGALYWITLGALVLLPPVLRRLHVTPLEKPQAATVQPPTTPAWRRAPGLAALLAVAWFIAGPPWHVAVHHRPIDFHEQVHLGPLQAIDKGYVPFVGPASSQYGPGTQLLTYAYMKLTDQFDLVGFREANLLQHFLTTVLVCLLAWWTIGLPEAFAVLVLGLSFSPLQFFSPAGDGTFQGAYGWGSGMRYLGALVVVPLTVRRLLAARAGRQDWRLYVIGAAAGVFVWLAQENLSATLAALVFVEVLLIATHTITWRVAVSATSQLVAGAGLVAIPIVVYYMVQGEFARFVRNYLLVPRAVASGFSNSWWLEGPGDPGYRAFCFTTAVIVVAAVAAIWHVRELRLRYPLNAAQARLLAYLAVLAASYHTALYRADSAHLLNTMIALPFVLVLVFRDLPEWTAHTPLARLTLRAVIVAVAIWVYPISGVSTTLYATVIKPSAVRFQQDMPARMPSSDPRPAYVRATGHLQDEPAVVVGAGSMRQFLEDVSTLKASVGDRRTLIASALHVYTGLIYFMGDLTPAPYLFDRETMMINAALAAESVAYMRQRMSEFDCVVSWTLEAPEVKAFVEANPGATTDVLTLAGAPVYVLVKP